MRRTGVRWIVLCVLLAAACGSTVDLKKGLQVDVISTGWLASGNVDGKNKLVPAISCTLKNVSNQNLSMIQVNALFRRVGENDEWGNGFITAVGSGGLAPGASTGVLTIKSDHGYTGTDPRADLIQNSQFVDARVDLLAKYGSTQWVRMGEYPIARQLMAR
jgi:hypothetical protein